MTHWAVAVAKHTHFSDRPRLQVEFQEMSGKTFHTKEMGMSKKELGGGDGHM